MQPQFTTQPQQQIVFQTSNNGIRQPAILAPSTMGAPRANMGQQQRVIQIQTANGPMYFAIAPGPAINSSPMMNQGVQGVQSQQYASQQICFQPNSSVMINRPQLNQTTTQQQLQPRLGAPIVAGQTLAISNPQQQNIVHPSSQPIVMPRMTNQLILNRPLNSTGQMMPGQQQFIQIQTPNGPMLLALPPQQTQPMNNTMIDYNNQVQKSQQQEPSKVLENTLSSPTKQVATSPTKSSNNSSPGLKPGLDLADLLLDCGILPEERMSSQSGTIKTPQSPSLPLISSPLPQMPQISSSMSPVDSSLHNTSNLQQQQQQPIQQNFASPMQQHPIRITIGPDGQMIMQHSLYGAIRPTMMAHTLGQPHLTPTNSTTTTNMISSSSPVMTSTTSNPTNTTNDNANNESSKTATRGKGSATKRSRSKKSELDKFPILKTPKIAQQQQQQQQQNMQAVTVVPMTVLVDQNKGVLGVSDGKSNVAQLAGGQQVSLAKIVAGPQLMRTSPLVQGNMMQQTSISQQNNIGSNTGMGQNSNLMLQNPHLVSVDSANSINTSNTINQDSTTGSLASSNQQLTSSGNVTTNSFVQKTDKSGTVESNPHISSSMMSTISLSIDSSKIEHNGFKPNDGQQQHHHTIKAVNNGGGITTLIIHQPQQQQQLQLQQNSQQQNQLTQVQQVARQIDLRAQSILNQLGADQNAALNPQTKQSFKSFEDACKRLLRYHVFDTQTVTEEQIKKGEFRWYTENYASIRIS